MLPSSSSPSHCFFSLLFPPHLFLCLVFSPFHLSLPYPPLPAESYFTGNASVQLNRSSFVLGTGPVLSITQPSDSLSPAGLLPPSATITSLPHSYILRSWTAVVGLSPSADSPLPPLSLKQSTPKVPLWLPKLAQIHLLPKILYHYDCHGLSFSPAAALQLLQALVNAHVNANALHFFLLIVSTVLAVRSMQLNLSPLHCKGMKMKWKS